MTNDTAIKGPWFGIDTNKAAQSGERTSQGASAPRVGTMIEGKKSKPILGETTIGTKQAFEILTIPMKRDKEFITFWKENNIRVHYPSSIKINVYWGALTPVGVGLSFRPIS